MSATLAPPAPASLARPDAPAAPVARIDGVDLLRGLVIAIMVIDHVRDYVSNTALLFQPTDLTRTTPALFLTRWITHLCAPTFAFLAGVGVYLQRRRALDRGESLGGVARYLLSRGLWLVVLEVTVVAFALDFRWPFLFLQIIWAIGIGFLTLAALVRVSPSVVLAMGVATVVGHQALAAALPPDAAALRFWLLPTPLPLGGFSAYPALPWVGVVWSGYGLGALFARGDAERRRAQLALGAGLLAAFIALRLVNAYGELVPWSAQARGPLYTALSFINVTKYPPTLGFVLLTLGVSLPLGVLVERLPGALMMLVRRVLLAFGRTPMFTYLVHFYLVHLTQLVLAVALGFGAATAVGFVSNARRFVGSGWGVELSAVYLIWLGTLAVLYPLSRWYGRVRRERRRWWMTYV